jgi:hypothetical protein
MYILFFPALGKKAHRKQRERHDVIARPGPLC